MTAPTHDYFQVAWVVNDLEAAMRRWTETLNVGPFFVISHARIENVRYRGGPAALDISAGLAQAGPVQIELIEQHNEGPSAYRDSFAKGQEGFHHVCSFTSDFDAEVRHYAELDCPIATQGSFGDMRYCYIDTRARVGHMTEVIEDRASIRAIFKMVADAAVGWDGKDPIRYL
jgi:hypothetical protein